MFLGNNLNGQFIMAGEIGWLAGASRD